MNGMQKWVHTSELLSLFCELVKTPDLPLTVNDGV